MCKPDASVSCFSRLKTDEKQQLNGLLRKLLASLAEGPYTTPPNH